MPATPALKLPRHLLANARVLACRDDILDEIPPAKVFVEVGVALGDFSKIVLEKCIPKRFVAIDTFNLHELTHLWGRPSAEALDNLRHRDFYERRFAGAITSGQVEVLEGDAEFLIHSLPNLSVDVFYIDAGHSYDEVNSQLKAILPKIKTDGIIILNDYTMFDFVGNGDSFYGVIQAAHKFMVEYEWEMIFLALHPHMFCDIVIKKVRRTR